MVVGKITAVFGIKGWVKVHSYTESPEDFFTFTHWYIQVAKRVSGINWQLIEFDNWRHHGKGLIAHIKNCDDRDIAQGYCQKEIAVDKTQLPELSEDDFYWSELVNMQVVTQANEILGVVKQMFETGANDVMIVSPSKESIDNTERLIPWVIDEVVLQVSRENRTIQVDWQPDYLS